MQKEQIIISFSVLLIKIVKKQVILLIKNDVLIFDTASFSRRYQPQV